MNPLQKDMLGKFERKAALIYYSNRYRNPNIFLKGPRYIIETLSFVNSESDFAAIPGENLSIFLAVFEMTGTKIDSCRASIETRYRKIEKLSRNLNFGLQAILLYKNDNPISHFAEQRYGLFFIRVATLNPNSKNELKYPKYFSIERRRKVKKLKGG